MHSSGIEVEGGVVVSVVPDDIPAIQAKLLEWSDGDRAVNLVFTTGGTGFGVRPPPCTHLCPIHTLQQALL